MEEAEKGAGGKMGEEGNVGTENQKQASLQHLKADLFVWEEAGKGARRMMEDMGVCLLLSI